MRYKDIIYLVNEIENEYPVDTFIYKKINYWVFLRHKLTVLTTDNIINKRSISEDFKEPVVLPPRKKLFSAFIIMLRLVLQIFRRNKAFVFGISGHRSELIDGKYYNRIADSINIVLSPSYSVIQFELLPDYQRSENAFSRVFNFSYLIEAIIYYLMKFRKHNEILKKQVVAFSDWVNKRNPMLNLNADQVIYDLERLYMRSAFYRFLFSIFRPKIVLFDVYYFAQAYSIIMAGKKNNIRTVDLQHGLITQNHSSYANFPVYKISEFEMLPSEFWVWDKPSFNVIHDWCNRCNSHKALITGNIFTQVVAENKIQLPAIPPKYQDFLSGHKLIVLLTLNDLLFEDREIILKNFLPCLALKSAQNIGWVIRIHPHFEIKVGNWFNSIGIRTNSNVLLHKAEEINLTKLLTHTRVHITFESTVAIEALNLGIPSIILNSTGCDYFSEYLGSGDFLYAGSPEQIINAIHTLTRYPNNK